MQKITNILSAENITEISKVKAGGVCVGHIIEFTDSGQAVVDYPGNPNDPTLARSILDSNLRESLNKLLSQNVLLLFENGDPSLPIITGLVHDELYPEVIKPINLTEKNRKEVFSDNEVLVFEAKKEIVLCCGNSSVTLRADGKVVVKGTQIVSRSSGANKIKGATVNIN